MEGLRLSQVNILHSYKRWYEGCNEFRCFFRATPFVSLQHYPDFNLSMVDFKKNSLFHRLEDIISKYNSSDTMFIFDFPSEETLQQGILFYKHHQLKPILNMHFMLHPYGIVGGKKFISMLLSAASHFTSIKTSGYVFLLDDDRFSEPSDADHELHFNNQYEVSDEDLPDAEMLTALQYKQVVYFYKSSVKEDIQPYFEYLKQHHFSVEMMCMM